MKSHVLVVMILAGEAWVHGALAANNPSIQVENLWETMAPGDPRLGFRCRAETVDQEGHGNATATT